MELNSSAAGEVVYDSGDSHGIKALAVMNDMRLRREFCDVIVQVDGKDIHAHKIVLASMCSYFMAMLTRDMKERGQYVIQLKELDPATVALLIEFAYTGKVVITEDNVQNMLYCASFFELAGIQKRCEEFLMMQLHPSNCLGIHSLALAHSCDELSKVSQNFICENFCQVVECEEFLKLSSPELQCILADSSLKVEHEEEVYYALMKWIKHCEGRSKNIGELLSKIRLALMAPEFLIDTVGIEEIILENSSARCLLDEAKNFLMLPERWASTNISPRCSKLLALVTVGGMDHNGQSLDTVEFFFPHSGVVDYTKASMNSKRSGLGVAVVRDKLYAIGGYDGVQFLNSVECYDPVCSQWQLVSAMNVARRYVGVTVWRGFVCAVGGHDGFDVLNSVEIYDPKSDRWQALPSLKQKRRHLAIHTLNGLLYAVGGHDGSNYLQSVERYDGYSWRLVASMHSPRAGVAVACVGGVLYAVGGYDGKENLSTCERYYPDDDCWTKIAPMNVSRSGHGLSVIGNRLYVIGGHDGQRYLSNAEWYHPHLGEWKVLGNLGSSRAVAGTCVLKQI